MINLSAHDAVPTFYGWREFPESGGLMSYGTSLADAYRQEGLYGLTLYGLSDAFADTLAICETRARANLPECHQPQTGALEACRCVSDEGRKALQ